jgi:hypothetical protein
MMWVFGYSFITKDKEEYQQSLDSQKLVTEDEKIQKKTTDSLCKKIIKNLSRL